MLVVYILTTVFIVTVIILMPESVPASNYCNSETTSNYARFKMATLYLTTVVVALLVTSTLLASGAPVYNDKANMLDKLASLLDQIENQEQAQMTGIDQKENLLSQMILEMLTNKVAEKESMEEYEGMALLQSIANKFQREREEQMMAEALKQKKNMLIKIQQELMWGK